MANQPGTGGAVTPGVGGAVTPGAAPGVAGTPVTTQPNGRAVNSVLDDIDKMQNDLDRYKTSGAQSMRPSSSTKVDKPASAKSSTEKPASAKPGSAKSSTEKPASAKPGSAKPATEKPASAKPGSAKPASN